MPTISRAYHAHSGNYTPGGNSCRYIVVHNTGNTAPARNEASYAQNNQHPSSYHYVLDGGGTIYQVLSDSDTAWAVGAWAGAKQIIGNNESISIEVCSNGTEFTEAEQQELAWLVQMLMAKWGIQADRVVRHWDCHTGRKNCPAYYSGASNPAWDALHERITGGDMDFKTLAPANAHVGDTVTFVAAAEADYNYAWAEGDGWDNWSSTVKETGSTTKATSGTFKPTKAGRYRLWIDVDGKTATKADITVTEAPEPEPTPEIDYQKLAEALLDAMAARLKD